MSAWLFGWLVLSGLAAVAYLVLGVLRGAHDEDQSLQDELDYWEAQRALEREQETQQDTWPKA